MNVREAAEEVATRLGQDENGVQFERTVDVLVEFARSILAESHQIVEDAKDDIKAWVKDLIILDEV